MIELQAAIRQFLDFCASQKKLSVHTLKAYSIDLAQFLQFCQGRDGRLDQESIFEYIARLQEIYKPKSAKRKTACLKAFCNHLENGKLITSNPFSKIREEFEEPQRLPCAISFGDIQSILRMAYDSIDDEGCTEYQRRSIIRDIAVLELLFATGMRVSELCSLKVNNINLSENSVRIFGKGIRERHIQIENSDALSALTRYSSLFSGENRSNDYYFINRLGNRLSEQSVRFMINKYAEKASISTRVTPLMFRQTFASLLLEEDVDIRHIQQLLGHTSIQTTQKYTHGIPRKQKGMLNAKHPRNRLSISGSAIRCDGDLWLCDDKADSIKNHSYQHHGT